MADNLRYYMNQKNVSRTELCRDLGFKYTTVAGWLTAEKYPRIDKIEIMAYYFGITKADLVEERTGGSTIAVIQIPVYGTIPAGIPMEAIQQILDIEEAPAEWAKGGKSFFALQIDGDSMSPNYLDGDVVIFQKQPTCENGQDCCVMVNGLDATFKRLFKNEKGITLQPLNPVYEVKVYSTDEVKHLPVTVLGVVYELRRKF